MNDSEKQFIEQVNNAVRDFFAEQPGYPDEDQVREQYEAFYRAFSSIPTYAQLNLDRANIIADLVQEYCAEREITKRIGFAYADEDTKKWLQEREDSIDWFYWERYKRYLYRTKGWSLAAVKATESDTYDILDLMADPMSEGPFERRGLVVASVQSGKTANYTGVICRAADAGYKVIIVMAGIHNVLRNQTQARLEEGFTGFDIVSRQPVGVGKREDKRRPVSCTSRLKDFNAAQADAFFALQTEHLNGPMLFVIKKNSTALKRVYEWLTTNAKKTDQLLLIDDEADNASINVKYKRDSPENDPSRINGQIRNILDYFDRRCYIGYTATPFANILIDPTVEHEVFGKDLFPNNFIYTLEESSDYYGADKVFGDYGDPYPKHLRYIDDIGLILPPKHKSDEFVEVIPESLKEAIRTYILATCIRILRGDDDKHSTMMINVSPYKLPQRSTSYVVRDYVMGLKHECKAYCGLPEQLALGSSRDLQMVKATWASEYKNTTEFGWHDIQNTLTKVLEKLRVISINTDTTDRLEYDEHVDYVIAVGGYRLSRGLTLEGLVVSYYSRNAKAYDALMQMARWFGYRPGYEDLCRIWMSEQAAGWYKFVADATTDLFDELRDMRQLNSTPQDYILHIRQSPDSLIVTARNKMGAGDYTEAPADLNGRFIETISLLRDQESLAHNEAAVKRLLERIEGHQRFSGKEYLYTDVAREIVTDFIDEFLNEDVRSTKTQIKPVLEYIAGRRADGELDTWDVLVAHGGSGADDEGSLTELPGVGAIAYERRKPGTLNTEEYVLIGDNHRLSSRGVEKAGLDDKLVEKSKDDFVRDHPSKKRDNCSDLYYRRRRTKPLLVVHPVQVRYSDKQIAKMKADGKDVPIINCWPTWETSVEGYGWSISFPRTTKETRPVKYVYNKVAMENMYSEFTEDSDDNTGDLVE